MPFKRILYLYRHSPHATLYPQEGLDVVLISAAFDQEISVVFLDDGVWALAANQQPKAIGRKDFAKGFRALEMHGVESLYAERESLCERGLSAGALLMKVEIVPRVLLSEMMEDHDVVLSF